MFLVQLGALALWKGGLDRPPEDPSTWNELLRGLTVDYPDDEPWKLVVESREKPAFMQPPDPGNLNWTKVPTPDALDLLITSRNHDVKKAVATLATAEDWVYALVSLQTCEGFGGRGNYGIARMNGGSSSRPMLSLAPTSEHDHSISPSKWWKRDTTRLLAMRQDNSHVAVGKPGGPALLWCLDWQDSEQLDITELDPWFMEVCRRIRLTMGEGVIYAERSTSKDYRIQSKAYKGAVGDPWIPIQQSKKTSSAKSFTLSDRDFDYARLNELMFSGDWEVPALARPGLNEESDMLLVAEALSRGNSKTEGFKSRAIPIPGRVLPLLSSKKVASIAQDQIKEIAAFDAALRNALALMAANGVRDDLQRKHYMQTNKARRKFDARADRYFFPSLWNRVNSTSSSNQGGFDAKVDFLKTLRQEAAQVLEEALPHICCSSIFRARAGARARRAFQSTLRREDACKELFIEEDGNART